MTPAAEGTAVEAMARAWCQNEDFPKGYAAPGAILSRMRSLVAGEEPRCAADRAALAAIHASPSIASVVRGWSTVRLDETPHADSKRKPVCATCGGARYVPATPRSLSRPPVPCPDCGAGRGVR